jgi:hypothetical protein
MRHVFVIYDAEFYQGENLVTLEMLQDWLEKRGIGWQEVRGVLEAIPIVKSGVVLGESSVHLEGLIIAVPVPANFGPVGQRHHEKLVEALVEQQTPVAADCALLENLIPDGTVRHVDLDNTTDAGHCLAQLVGIPEEDLADLDCV